ncbi:hypothetical protein Patl1_27508 [Pistacia atlantica]|uniref:Uncharacterized protein n=1 Tax=Pistacia atlantica TaxID=434234 RepID=A0ACC1BGT7_9ROSI|nr:hypothetical protein Patl1_27508 [Pistacia atlantica]
MSSTHLWSLQLISQDSKRNHPLSKRCKEWRNWTRGTALNMIDFSLRGCSSGEMIRCIHIGLLCVQEKVANRPTMSSVVLMLTSHSQSLPIPSKPAFFMQSSSELDYSESSMLDYSENDALFSLNEASITELDPR